MEKLSDSPYRKLIEDLKEGDSFEREGDEIFLEHSDREARILWAFHRPSGSHPSQIEDSDIDVSAMAFNHSRLTPYERIRRVHRDLLQKENLIKINNRMRMLFRSLTDGDFTELLTVLKEFPILKEYATDQCINGRRMLETEVNLEAVSEFLDLVKSEDKKFLDSIALRLPIVEEFDSEELKEFLKECRGKDLHPLIKTYIKTEVEKWCEDNSLHILQRKQIEKLMRGS